MQIDDFALLVEILQMGKAVSFFRCPACGAAVGELSHGQDARHQHIFWHVMGK